MEISFIKKATLSLKHPDLINLMYWISQDIQEDIFIRPTFLHANVAVIAIVNLAKDQLGKYHTRACQMKHDLLIPPQKKIINGLAMELS